MDAYRWLWVVIESSIDSYRGLWVAMDGYRGSEVMKIQHAYSNHYSLDREV